MKRAVILAVGLAAALGGCALLREPVISMAVDFAPPGEYEIESTLYVDASPAQVWDRVFETLVASDFEMDDFDVESSVITVSTVVDTPERYVDCGRSLRTYYEDEDREEFDSPAAGSYVHKIACSATKAVATRDFSADGQWTTTGYRSEATTVRGYVTRTSGLEAVASVRIAPEGEGSSVRVDIEYELTSIAMRTYEDGWPYPNPYKVEPETTVVHFRTAAPASSGWGFPGKQGMVTCRSTGKLEREILSLLGHIAPGAP